MQNFISLSQKVVSKLSFKQTTGFFSVVYSKDYTNSDYTLNVLHKT